METIIEKLEQYRKRNGFEHTKYATREDSSGDLRAITFTLSGWLGKFTIEKDIATKQLVFKDFSKINLISLAYFAAMGGYVLQNTITPPLLFSLVIASMITFSIIILLREIKITDLKRFLFE
ncbi:hypothetical protein [Shewanella sp.]|uniref:hypothetical protein n=1 Tax=Shewanella sp. TaxID=50422 RepID=UPI00258C2E00|nr:hypothetical protein [Shewanella sp.]MCJ8304915.1 hypothetical protein [Shewanella sp.]